MENEELFGKNQHINLSEQMCQLSQSQLMVHLVPSLIEHPTTNTNYTQRKTHSSVLFES